MKKTIFTKILIGFIVTTAALSAAFAYFSFRTIRASYLVTLVENMENLGQALIPQIKPFVENGKYKELERFARDTEKKINARITVIRPDGKVLADSEKDPAIMENHIHRPEIAEVLKGEGNRSIGYSVRFSSTMREKMLYLAIPVTDSENKVKWILRLSLFMRHADALIKELRDSILRITGIILVFSLILAFFIARRLSEPVRKLGSASKKLASGDFDASVIINSGDEIQDAADSFNLMAKQIKKLFTEISAQKEELNSIIASIREGLIAADSKDRVVLVNESLKSMLPENLRQNVVGRPYWELMISPRFNELMEKAGREKRGITEQIEASGRSYLMSVNYLSHSQTRTAILYDITGIKEFEEMKKDFVANVSHELKTPLTAIKGFTETIAAETADEGSKRYLAIISRHTERLINIVEDLLALSGIERDRNRAEFEEIMMGEIVNGVARMFDYRMSEKGLFMNLYIQENLPKMKGDAFRIEQMLINLIDNAFKYTEKGGITISVSSSGNNIIVEVEDTGIGIPQESLPRLFERFYTVDKSRSRKMGGTGLGLSIVKHIVLMHGGEINVKSEINKGTKFTVTLPLIPA